MLVLLRILSFLVVQISTNDLYTVPHDGDEVEQRLCKASLRIKLIVALVRDNRPLLVLDAARGRQDHFFN